MSSRAEVLDRLPPNFASVAVQMDDSEEGAVIAAAFALKRLLANAGLNWRTILPVLLPDPEPKRTEPPEYEPTPNDAWRICVLRCLERAWLLGDWEQKFLRDLRNFPRLSPKQAARLDVIAKKLGIDGAAR